MILFSHQMLLPKTDEYSVAEQQRETCSARVLQRNLKTLISEDTVL